MKRGVGYGVCMHSVVESAQNSIAGGDTTWWVLYPPPMLSVEMNSPPPPSQSNPSLFCGFIWLCVSLLSNSVWTVWISFKIFLGMEQVQSFCLSASYSYITGVPWCPLISLSWYLIYWLAITKKKKNQTQRVCRFSWKLFLCTVLQICGGLLCALINHQPKKNLDIYSHLKVTFLGVWFLLKIHSFFYAALGSIHAPPMSL